MTRQKTKPDLIPRQSSYSKFGIGVLPSLKGRGFSRAERPHKIRGFSPEGILPGLYLLTNCSSLTKSVPWKRSLFLFISSANRKSKRKVSSSKTLHDFDGSGRYVTPAHPTAVS